MMRFKSLLVAVEPELLPAPGAAELSVELRSQLEGAFRLAEHAGCDVTVISVTPEGSGADELVAEAVTARLTEHVLPALGREGVEVLVIHGVPFMEITRQVLRGGHDMLALAACRPESGPRIVGSTATQLIRKCPCPVWVASRVLKPVGPRTVLSAVGLHECSIAILEASAALVALRGGEWHVMHVPEYPHEGGMRLRGVNNDKIQAYEKTCRDEAFAAIHAMVDPLAERTGVTPKLWMAEGSAHEQIAQAEKRLGADLVVMGTVGRGGLAGMLIGNTAERVLQLIESSVLAIKPPGFVCPVEL